MTNEQIDARMQYLAKTERKITREVLELINLARVQKTYLVKHGSLLEWLTKGHGYSEPAANRRIQAAKLLQAVPSVGLKIESAELNLSTLTAAQSVIRAQEKLQERKFNETEMTEVIDLIQGKTFDQATLGLARRFPKASRKSKESLRPVAEDEHKLTTILDDETIELLKRAKELLSHVEPDAKWADIIKRLAKEFVDRKDPLKKKPVKTAPAESAKQCVESPVNTAPIPAWMKRAVRQRDGDACTQTDPATGARCFSRYQVQVDHIIPRSMGGSNTLENLRCLCRLHNVLAGEEKLGRKLMQRWRSEVRERSVSYH